MKTLLSCLLVLISVGSVNAEIVLPDKGDKKAAAAKQTIVAKVPGVFVNVKTEVDLRSVTEAQIVDMVGNPNVIGLYYNFPPRIYVDAGVSGDLWNHVCVHEYGHFVWFRLMTMEERAEYVEVWEILKKFDALPTPYSRVHPDEGFAEAFTFYCLRKSELDVISTRIVDRLAKRLKETSTYSTQFRGSEEWSIWNYSSRRPSIESLENTPSLQSFFIVLTDAKREILILLLGLYAVTACGCLATFTLLARVRYTSLRRPTR